MLIGRGSSCDLRIDHATVSSEHAVVYWDDTAWFLRDLGSRNGTQVGGRALRAGVPERLDEGAVVHFGRCTDPWTVVSTAAPLTGDVSVTAAASLALEALTVHFVVSTDEEHVSWSVEQGGQSVSLGDRVHTYLLLTLARQRLHDADVPEPARGWCYADELARRLGITPEVMKVYVYRARRQLDEAGVHGAGGLLERRAATNQIRLATDRIVIRRGS